MTRLTFTELRSLFMQGVFIRHMATYMIFTVVLIYLCPSEQEMHDKCFTGLDGNICPEGFELNITNGEVQCYHDFCVQKYGVWVALLHTSIIFIFLGLLADFLFLISYIVFPETNFDIMYLSMIAYPFYMIFAAINILFLFSFAHIKADSHYIICNTILLILHITILCFEVNLSDVLHKLKGSDFFAKEKEPVQTESDKGKLPLEESDKGELLQAESDEVESERAENSTKE